MKAYSGSQLSENMLDMNMREGPTGSTENEVPVTAMQPTSNLNTEARSPASRIILSTLLSTESKGSGAGRGWGQLADAINHLVDGNIDSCTVLRMAALQLAYRDIISISRKEQPDYFDTALRTADCTDSFAGLPSQFCVPVDYSDYQTALILDVMSKNGALNTTLALPLGVTEWRNDGSLTDATQLFKQVETTGPIIKCLRAHCSIALQGPSNAAPDDLEAQLEWIMDNWDDFITDEVRELYLLSKDVAAEIYQMRMGGSGRAEMAKLETSFGALSGDQLMGHYATSETAGYVDEKAQFSDDADWMPRLVMIAKQTYVWLDQLSAQYQRPIQRLDEIPDEELVRLADKGFSGLWLIGLWERSDASRAIKVKNGNPEAAASAYALKGYRIADKLGGQSALDTLRSRAAQQGLRLAADMVPNHMGMDSDWMVEHPDWFLQLPYAPYPGYSFNGPNVSGDDRLEIYLEDGYWDQTDAAVVFKCVNHTDGSTRYVYHGNDGTQMPWNDTAQLDYLKPVVREAVIQTILEVARNFPVIRFDAAMTLARKHIARLWYPPPGHGGAIPSRAENSVPQEVFDRLVPGEFWREVVERVRQEVPDTLLLAEAFWMMEGYFVRTLGMHRVYNSAFMHMLRDEDNAGYRSGIKGVLEYSPAILERYVNFMNNPDEETAVEQFGKGDKYFGIATMMATLPGLPMFGHGQIEGFSEKYGMEYTRAYRNEQPDHGLMEHHERVIFPLLRDRHLFCGVENFVLFDFWVGDDVNENVFAFANKSKLTGEYSLVLYNNGYDSTSGWIKSSTAINVGDSDAPILEHRTLAQSMGIERADDTVYGLWDLRQQAWLLRTGRELTENGLFAQLGGYQAHVFTRIVNLSESADHIFVDGLMRRAHGGWISSIEPNIKDESELHETDEIEPIQERTVGLDEPIQATSEPDNDALMADTNDDTSAQEKAETISEPETTISKDEDSKEDK
ncbi:MAG: alpha-amylase family glycosyl hydrolase [Myxococcota bacterium]|nr:alpha-amylase family glycosyl hydrolase [Myxococcota bacterium]